MTSLELVLLVIQVGKDMEHVHSSCKVYPASIVNFENVVDGNDTGEVERVRVMLPPELLRRSLPKPPQLSFGDLDIAATRTLSHRRLGKRHEPFSDINFIGHQPAPFHSK